MANLSITRAWNEAAEFVRREAGLIFPVAFLLLALPNALLEAFTPPAPAPGESPEPGLWLLLIPLLGLASIVGNVAISYLALRPGSSVGEALRRGAGRMPALLGAGLLVGLGFLILFFIVAGIVFALVPGAIAAVEAGATTGAMVTAVTIVFLLVLPVAFYFGARLMLTTPVAAAEGAGVFQILKRSWQLTTGHVWKLVGFLVLVGILVGVLTGAIRAVTGILFAIVAGPLEPGSTSAWLVIVVMSLANMVVFAYLNTTIARIYAQLAGERTDQVFA